jgi:hypothetical protein
MTNGRGGAVVDVVVVAAAALDEVSASSVDATAAVVEVVGAVESPATSATADAMPADSCRAPVPEQALATMSDTVTTTRTHR